MLVVLITFAIVMAIMVIPYWLLVLRPEQGQERKLKHRLKVAKPKDLPRPELLHTETPLSNVNAVNRLLSRLQVVTNPIRRQIVQAGMNVTVGVILLASALLGLLVFFVAYWLTGYVLIAAAVAPAAAFLPYVFVRWKANRRLWKFEEQFPEAIELLARALRAGHAFTTGLEMVATEMPEPVGDEFRLVYDRQAFGMQISDALRDMAKRVPLLDARFFVTAVLTQRESGGNLAEVLDNLAHLMRERFKVKRQVRTLSAHGRITGWVLGCLAPVIAGLLTALAPEHMSLMVTDPLGRAMVAGAIVLQIIGIYIMRRVINIEV